MEHVNDLKLLDYVGGRLPAAESEQVRRHIAKCSACASRYREALATWDALGEWRIDPSAHQVAGRIETLAAQAESQQRPKRTMLIPLRDSLVAALRIAAAIIIATSGGYVLGKYSTPQNAPITPMVETGPRYLAALDFEWSSELTWTVLEENTAGGANRQ